MTTDTGGNAFPTLLKQGDLAVAQGGLTVRDAFAIAALPSLISVQSFDSFPLQVDHDAERNIERDICETAARLAYAIADALMRERGDV